LIDLNCIEQKINEKTKAIIPVHLFGQAVDMTSLKKIAEKYNLFIIEDCAQAHYAEWDGKRVGSFGDAGTFSFFPGKNLGAYGDAGAIITNNDELAKKMKMFSNHGALIKHRHAIEGINSRLDGLQAAILTVKLKYIERWTKQRQNAAELYTERLALIDSLEIPKINNKSTHVFHLYVVRVEKREELQVFLKSKGIQTGIHYPNPLPFLDAYKYLNHSQSDFPQSYEYKGKILSLPIYPEITIDQINYVCDSIKEFFN